MSITSKMYGQFLLKALNKEVNLPNGATGLKVLLTTSSYTPDQDSHVYKSSITNEVTGTGYVAGGAAIANVTVTYDSSSNTIKIDGDDVVWNNSTITARYAVLYDSTTGVDSTSPLIALIDMGSDMSSNNGNFTITFDSAGIFTISTT